MGCTRRKVGENDVVPEKTKKKKETSQINYDSPSRFTERWEVENEGRSRGESIREGRVDCKDEK